MNLTPNMAPSISTRLGLTVRLVVPAAVLVVVTACGGNGGSGATTLPGSQPAPMAVAPAQAGPATEEEPLTGEVKQRAEQAALASFPGTVLKSEYDVERPGMLAVEIRQASGETVEVYLDRNYTVVDTKDEEGDDDGGQAGGDGY